MAPTVKKVRKSTPWYSRHPQLAGAIILVFAVLQFGSIYSFQDQVASNNVLGLIGHVLGSMWLKTFGVTAYPLMISSGWLGAQLMFGKEYSKKQLIIASVCLISLTFLFTLAAEKLPGIEAMISNAYGFTNDSFRLGGLPAHFLYKVLPHLALENLLNFTGTLLIMLAVFLLTLSYIFEERFQKLLEWTKEKWESVKNYKWSWSQKTPTINDGMLWQGLDEKSEKKPIFGSAKLPSILSRAIDLHLPKRDKQKELSVTVEELPLEKPVRPKKLLTHSPEKQKHSDYKLPSFDLLNQPKRNENQQLAKELKQKAEQLEETLMSFGIEAKVGQIYSGPTITSFEVHPAIGVKVGRIKTLEHDIALNLEAKSIRIIAPIPGKAAVGIEVPNKVPQEVSFKELLNAYAQQGNKFNIPLLLGKTVSGEIVMSDLCKMPHCIIAGATGSGKSVCINSIVMSILMTASPDEIRLLMVDPKKVELSPYSELPHMLAPVITDPKTACMALNWLVAEMDKRYEYLKLTGQRNIEGFNRRKIDKEAEKALPMEIPEKLAYYVAIIDELADLMMVASSDIETPIARIAQMARAVGIHLILATQRPSREVITGLIKANFPARIAFKVASRVNSQIVLDDIGAETLLGNGDMLFLMPGSSQSQRAQGVFVRDDEINRVIKEITAKYPPQYVIASFDRLGEFSNSFEDDSEPNDELYEEAKNVVLSTGNASTTFLQRKLKIGYARAASLMDDLERKGVVGPQEGAKPRKIFFPKSMEEPVAIEELDD